MPLPRLFCEASVVDVLRRRSGVRAGEDAGAAPLGALALLPHSGSHPTDAGATRGEKPDTCQSTSPALAGPSWWFIGLLRARARAARAGSQRMWRRGSTRARKRRRSTRSCGAALPFHLALQLTHLTLLLAIARGCPCKRLIPSRNRACLTWHGARRLARLHSCMHAGTPTLACARARVGARVSCSRGLRHTGAPRWGPVRKDSKADQCERRFGQMLGERLGRADLSSSVSHAGGRTFRRLGRLQVVARFQGIGS